LDSRDKKSEDEDDEDEEIEDERTRILTVDELEALFLEHAPDNEGIQNPLLLIQRHC